MSAVQRSLFDRIAAEGVHFALWTSIMSVGGGLEEILVNHDARVSISGEHAIPELLETYKRSKVLTNLLLFISGISGAFAYQQTKDKYWLVGSGLMIAGIPYCALLESPVAEQLKYLTLDAKSEKARSLLTSWGNIQLGKLALAVGGASVFYCYNGELNDDIKLEQALTTDLKSEGFLPYAKLIAWLTQELNGFYSIGEFVQDINSINDISSFLLELGGFLRDYGCPYQNLVNSDNRLNDRVSRLQLLDFLCTEIQAAKMNKCFKRNVIATGIESTTNKKQYESDEARDLKALLVALGFPRPPDGITAGQICSKVYGKVSEVLKTLSPNHLGRPLLKMNMSEIQWKQMHKINKVLYDDYKTRRELLLKRLDVTIQSFKWAERLKDKTDEIANVFMTRRKALTAEPNVRIEDIMAAREDLCHTEKTCGTKEIATTRSKLHKILMPKVPDRGGRTTELQAPPPEMPSYQRGGSAGGARRGGGGQQHQNNEQRGHRGGAGWSARGGGGGDRPHSGGYQQQNYGAVDPHMQPYPQMAYQGQQQIVNEYAGMDHSGNYGGRGRGGRGGRGGRRPY
ncbi:unnamed protein product [Rotaria socialis]|uniref:Protein FAM98A n=1 Tax=Rotaria socialis TaxID=392032 RepID=A0A820MSG0_9BILA|nr:unnamed protein product [Rotaria socialis]CAF4238003.1 unnamed protein product [Rotaria socialis]CAF4378311.1 unnamed protein product [Rotaria socialis]CAF4612734.1 unnamed protein product [Rotaria socialis]CAF4724915.1 unnamed protein product [Rotaria socialis]